MRKALSLLLALLILSSCKTQHLVYDEPQTAVTQDTIRVIRERLDSIFVHDSVFVRQTPETTYIERWHTRYHTEIRYRDSVRVRIDSIPYPVTVTKREPYTPIYYKVLACIGLLSIVAIIAFLFRR